MFEGDFADTLAKKNPLLLMTSNAAKCAHTESKDPLSAWVKISAEFSLWQVKNEDKNYFDTFLVHIG